MSKNVSNEEIASLCLELSMLLHAGIDMGDALSLLAQESGDQAILSGLAERVDDGVPLSAALKESKCFPVYVCGLIEVGERTGRTEEALAALSQYYEDRVRMSRRIRGALLYPAVMLGLTLLVIGVLLVKVLPIFDDVYASFGGRLSGILALGRWLERVMPVLWCLLAVLAGLAAAYALSEPFRAALEAMVSRVEPALVLACSLLVGLILLSVMLPLMNIMAAIG